MKIWTPRWTSPSRFKADPNKALDARTRHGRLLGKAVARGRGGDAPAAAEDAAAEPAAEEAAAGRGLPYACVGIMSYLMLITLPLASLASHVPRPEARVGRLGSSRVSGTHDARQRTRESRKNCDARDRTRSIF